MRAETAVRVFPRLCEQASIFRNQPRPVSQADACIFVKMMRGSHAQQNNAPHRRNQRRVGCAGRPSTATTCIPSSGIVRGPRRTE